MGVKMTNYTPNDASMVGHFTGINVKLGDLQDQIDALVPPGTGVVTTWNTRTGDVVPAASDYAAIQVDYAPSGGIQATDVQSAIAELDTDKAKVVHQHQLSDITDSGALAALDTVGEAQIDADSVGPSELKSTTVVPGSYTTADITVDAQGRITGASDGSAGGGGVDSWNTRTGAVVPVASDYDAVQVDNTPYSELAEVDVQAAINWLVDQHIANRDRIDALEEIIVHLVPAGHGSMTISGVKSGSDFSGNRIIDDYDEINIPGDAVSPMPSDGTMRFNFEGVWVMYFNFSVKHDKDSGDRLMELELWDLTADDTVADAIFLFVPPDREGTTYSLTLPITIGAAEVGRRYQWRIDGDDFSSIEWRQLSWGATYADELAVVADPYPER